MASIKALKKRLARQGLRATVSRREFFQRIDRKLAAQGRSLRLVRGRSIGEAECYCLLGPGPEDMEGPIDLEALGCRLRVLQPWEALQDPVR